MSALQFGISRSHGGLQLLEGAHQFANCLAEIISMSVRVSTHPTYDSLYDALDVKDVDFAWMPPLLHARAAQDGHELACVCERQGALTYRSALLVRKESTIHSVADLARKTAAWVDPSSVSGYLFPRLYLSAQGFDPVRDFALEKFCGSATLAATSVVRGEADVCACFVSAEENPTPEQQKADMARALGPSHENLRVFAVTDEIPPDGLVLRRDLDPEVAQKLKAGLLALERHPDGSSSVSMLFEASRLVAVTPQVEQVVARLRAQL